MTMKHSISNAHLHVSVLNQGTELCSLKSNKTGVEYMWQANPKVWGSHAPVLFPAIGSFRNDVCTIDGKEYQIPKHGFIRHNEELVLHEKTETELHFLLNYSDKTLSIYPYKFRFTISFKLQANKLIVSHKVENLEDQEIYFSLGGHPAFNCPLRLDEEYSDYYIEFEKVESASSTLLSENGLITNNTTTILTNSNILNLHPTLFNNDALIFKELKSRKVRLKSKKSSQVLSLSFADFKYLGLWAKPNAPFVCIEPWLGIADHENTDGDYLKKDGLIKLPKGESFEASFEIEIEE